MTDALQKLIELLKMTFTWWFFVEPWEQAVRLRAGSRLRLCGPGVHFRVPFLDAIYVHNTRAMVTSGPAQTVSSADGKVFVIGVTVSYRVTDVLLLHRSVHHAEPIICQRIAQGVAEYVHGREAIDIAPDKLQRALDGIGFADMGLGDISACVNNFASVRTYRVINDCMSPWEDRVRLSTSTRKP